MRKTNTEATENLISTRSILLNMSLGESLDFDISRRSSIKSALYDINIAKAKSNLRLALQTDRVKNTITVTCHELS